MSEDSFAVKRTIPRVSLTASAEVVERGGNTRSDMRVSELSARGCYLDTLNPLSIGTLIDLRVSHDNQTWDACGKVIYSHAGFGMGVLFVDLSADQREVLSGWLGQLGGRPD